MIPHQNLFVASRALSRLITPRGLKLRVAESFTGGLICSSITKISGASNFLDEGIICYSLGSKTARLGVSPSTLEAFGAVSCATVKEMLIGLLNAGADIAIATSGNAGPTAQNGGAGIYFVGVATKAQIIIEKSFTQGARADVIKSGALKAINMAIRLIQAK